MFILYFRTLLFKRKKSMYLIMPIRIFLIPYFYDLLVLCLIN